MISLYLVFPSLSCLTSLCAAPLLRPCCVALHLSPCCFPTVMLSLLFSPVFILSFFPSQCFSAREKTIVFRNICFHNNSVTFTPVETNTSCILTGPSHCLHRNHMLTYSICPFILDVKTTLWSRDRTLMFMCFFTIIFKGEVEGM